MTGAQLYAFFEELVGDSPSDTWFYNVANAKKDELEANRQWAYLRKTDTSLTRSTSDTWETQKSLPSDFATPLRLFVGTAMTEHSFVPFDRLDQKDTDGTVRIDMANLKLLFNGTAGSTGTVYLTYQRYSPEIASGTSPLFPDRFHKLLAYEAAKEWFAKDQSERALAWNQEHGAEGASILAAMERWDDRIRAAELNQDINLNNQLDLA